MLNNKKLLSLILAVCVSMTSFSVPAYADLAGEEESLSDMLEEAGKAQSILNELESKKGDAEEYIEEMDSNLTEINTEIYEIEQKLDKTKTKIKKLKKKLKAQEKSIDEQYNAMKLRIQFMYENGDTEVANMIFSSTSISDFLNKAEYISEISSYDRDMLEKMKETKASIVKNKSSLEEKKEELETLKADQEIKQSDVETLIAAKQEQLDSYNSQIDSSNEELEDIEGEIAAQKSIISKLREEESSRAAAEESSREAASKDSETSSTNEETTKAATSTNAATGMIWPLPGYSTLSSYFGYRTDPISGETSYHSGLDIPAPSGTPIYAAASGTVSWAQFNSSAGNWTGIYHGDGLYTVYMHQSVMLVSPGDYVEQGEVIGLVGTTGRSTGNHLHFSVILHGNYVEPLNYVSP